MACKRIHQLFCFVDGFLMLICRVKYLFVPLSPFCHSVYPVLVTHFIYLCAWLHSCAHVFFIMLFHCHPVSTQSIQCGLLEGLAGQSVFTSSAIHSASWSARKKGGEEKKPCEKKSSTMNTEEVHNANSFPNTTDCFKHNERKPALFAELHFNKQQAHKGLATQGLSRTKPPRRSKRSCEGRQSSFSPGLFSPEWSGEPRKEGKREVVILRSGDLRLRR